MITLYGYGRVHPRMIGEGRDLRAQWALEETGLPYRINGLDYIRVPSLSGTASLVLRGDAPSAPLPHRSGAARSR